MLLLLLVLLLVLVLVLVVISMVVVLVPPPALVPVLMVASVPGSAPVRLPRRVGPWTPEMPKSMHQRGQPPGSQRWSGALGPSGTRLGLPPAVGPDAAVSGLFSFPCAYGSTTITGRRCGIPLRQPRRCGAAAEWSDGSASLCTRAHQRHHVKARRRRDRG